MQLITHATLPDGRSHQRVLIDNGRFVAIGPDLPTPEGAEIIDAKGWLLSPPFVDAHFHMDATLSLRPAAAERSRARCSKASRCGAS